MAAPSPGLCSPESSLSSVPWPQVLPEPRARESEQATHGQEHMGWTEMVSAALAAEVQRKYDMEAQAETHQGQQWEHLEVQNGQAETLLSLPWEC